MRDGTTSLPYPSGGEAPIIDNDGCSNICLLVGLSAVVDDASLLLDGSGTGKIC